MTANNRLWIIGTVALAIAIVVFGWIVGISPQLKQAAASDRQRATVDATNRQQTAALATLKADYSRLPSITTQLEQLQAQLPSNSDYPAFLGELNTVAGQASVDVTNVSFSAPAVLPVAGASADAAPATGTVPAGSTVAIPTTLALTGSFGHLQSAIKELQTGSRLFLVSGFSLASGAGTGASAEYTASITGLLYVLTDGATLVAQSPAATSVPSTPPPTSTPSPTSTPTSTP